MTLRPLPAARFVRKARLGPGEYRKNFHQVDREIVSAVTSPEADEVTPLMSKIYLRLVNAPAEYWEREGVLRVEAETREGKSLKAWAVLCELLGVASATASKALGWMHEQGIIGYFAGKNGVGIRIFLNRAASSIGTRKAGEKILEFPRASSAGARASRDEAAFIDSFADLEVSDTDCIPPAPKSGAGQTKVVDKVPNPPPRPSENLSRNTGAGDAIPPRATFRLEVPVEEIVSRLRLELEPALQSAARQAAAQEHARTREWLESRGLPKAARVAQREAYNVLRTYGVINERGKNYHAQAGARGGEQTAAGPHPLSREEVEELAQACVAMLEVQGQAIERTLTEMSLEAGGFLPPSDVAKVRERAALLTGGSNG